MEEDLRKQAKERVSRTVKGRQAFVERCLSEARNLDKPRERKQEEDLLSRLMKRYGKEARLLFRVIRGRAYHRVVQDLVAYTGLSLDEVLDRVALRHGEHGHFAAEFDWDRPRTPTELGWFYRSCKGYLFGNASRPSWEALDVLGEGKGRRVLDFGGGIGQNAIELAERGFQVIYFDVSIIQSDFTSFRASARKLSTIKITDPFFEGRFNFLEAVPGDLDAVVMQDVLEHIPGYLAVLQAVSSRMRAGALLIEYSPFNGKLQCGKLPRPSPLHCQEAIPLEKAMDCVGLEKTGLGVRPVGVWRKR